MKKLQASEVLTLLATSSESFLQIRLREQASIRELRLALAQTRDTHSQQVLCDVLGFRHARSAVPLLIQCLEDSASGVRNSAADALGKIGDLRAGTALMHHFQQETELPVRRTLACALGAVGCKPAIPLLIESLYDLDASLRGCAAWSLGILHATEAIENLRDILSREKETYPKTRIEVVLHSLNTKNNDKM